MRSTNFPKRCDTPISIRIEKLSESAGLFHQIYFNPALIVNVGDDVQFRHYQETPFGKRSCFIIQTDSLNISHVFVVQTSWPTSFYNDQFIPHIKSPSRGWCSTKRQWLIECVEQANNKRIERRRNWKGNKRTGPCHIYILKDAMQWKLSTNAENFFYYYLYASFFWRRKWPFY